MRPRYSIRFAPPMNARSRTGSDPSCCRKTDLVLTLYVSGLRESWAGRVLGRAAARMGGWGSGLGKRQENGERWGHRSEGAEVCVGASKSRRWFGLAGVDMLPTFRRGLLVSMFDRPPPPGLFFFLS